MIENRYLLRVFSSEHVARREEEFNVIKQLSNYSNYIPAAIEFGHLKDSELAYMILTYMPGKDGENGLIQLSNTEQYNAGFKVGEELVKLHTFKAPTHIRPWYEIKKQKSEKYLEELTTIHVDDSIKNLLTAYIDNNIELMRDRPNTFQHDDFHPANLLIHNRAFAGIIDFQRMDWGDPIHDLHKLGFFPVALVFHLREEL